MTDDGEVTLDDDSDAAGPENVDKDGNLEVPQGQRMLNRPPAPLNFAAVRRLKIALKRPFGDCVGWEISKVIQFVTRAGINKGRWLIKFEDGVEYYWPKEPSSEYGRNKKWVLLQNM